jgi:hypothetical protein
MKGRHGMQDTESTTPLADALAEVDAVQNSRAVAGTGTELEVLRRLADVVRRHLVGEPERIGRHRASV